MSTQPESEGIPSRFQKALQETEEKRDASMVAKLFRKDARLTNLGGDHGADVEQFWQTYLDQFSEIRSEFIAQIISEKCAALEWRSRGKLADGHAIDYRGVSLIEFDDQGVTAFRTYYDSALFVRDRA